MVLDLVGLNIADLVTGLDLSASALLRITNTFL